MNRFQSVELNHKVPWIVVVYKFLQKWQDATGLNVPTNYKAKCALKQMIQAGMWMSKHIHVKLLLLTFGFPFLAITKEEENYEEAVKAINSCFGGGKPNSILLDILNDPACVHLTKDVSKPKKMKWHFLISKWNF